ncbi:MAG: hypothetical protein KC506_03510, partial [Nanoarchaeota archaeon]|nr:hypothetical protein [Nanoarchaeota archaeon]
MKKEDKMIKKKEREMEKLLKKTVLKEEKRKSKEVRGKLKMAKQTKVLSKRTDLKNSHAGHRKEIKAELAKPMAKVIKKDEGKVQKNQGIKLGFMAAVALLVLSSVYYFISGDFLQSLLVFIGVLILGVFSFFVRKRLKYYGDIKKMENVFPDFISLMSSNLRAGMTIDRALLLSSRKEFAPLDKEILQVGKDILTAKEISVALKDMADR